MNMEKNSTAITLIEIPVSDLELSFIIPEDNKLLTKKGLKEIHNAWTSSAGIDNNGSVWILVDKLHSILRTETHMAKYYIDYEIETKYKRTVNEKTYIKGCEVMALLNRLMENARYIRRLKYLKYSEDIYLRIRDSEIAKNKKAERYEEVDRYRDELRRTKIAKMELELCELTNQILIPKKNDFSHIRSVSYDLELADKLWNGLVVNRSIHEIITKRHIIHEEQLLALCQEQGWNINWYDKFKHELNRYYNNYYF